MEPAKTEAISEYAKFYLNAYLELYDKTNTTKLKLKKAIDRSYELTGHHPWKALKNSITDAVVFRLGRMEEIKPLEYYKYIGYYLACEFVHFLTNAYEVDKTPLTYRDFIIAHNPCRLTGDKLNFLYEVSVWKRKGHIDLDTSNATEIEAMEYRFAEIFTLKVEEFDMRKCVADACEQIRIGTVIDTDTLLRLI